MAQGCPTVRACISQILLFFCLSIFIYILYEKVWLEPGELSYVHVSCCCMGCFFFFLLNVWVVLLIFSINLQVLSVHLDRMRLHLVIFHNSLSTCGEVRAIEIHSLSYMLGLAHVNILNELVILLTQFYSLYIHLI